MYKLIESDKEIRKVRSFCAKGYFGARINTVIAAYGADDRFVRTWYEEKNNLITGVVQVAEGAAAVCCTDETDYDSLSALLLFAGAKTVIGERTHMEKLPFAIHSQGVLMDCPTRTGESVYAQSVGSEQLNLLFRVLAADRPRAFERRCYADWYTDMSHRVRHGLTECFAVFDADDAVSCASVLYSNAQYGCIGAVETLPAYRNRGFGRDCTLAAADSVFKNGQIPCLACSDSGIQKWYEGMGFSVCGQWIQMDI
ncbi:MAG: hypothetical protein E7523_05400 [Ruminococcaceae bacterium]|nr:hypothetical protein [Oscillospiraceae bacterium]